MAGVPQGGYQHQVGPGGSGPFAGASPEAFGAGVGAEMAHLGGVLGEAGLQAHKLELERQRDAEASDIGLRLARASVDLKTTVLNDVRPQSPPDGTGHADRVGQLVDQQLGGILGDVRNETLRGHFQQVAENIRGGIVGEEVGWAHGQRAEFQHKNMVELGQTIAGAETISPSADFQTKLDLIRTTTDAQNGMDPNIRRGVSDELQRQATAGHYEGVLAQDPHVALAMLDRGDYAEHLTHDDIDGFRTKAETLIHRKEVEDRAQQAVVVRQQKEEEATYRARAEQGVQVDPKDGEALAARAEARGDTSTAVQLRAAATGARAAAVYGGPTVLPAQITARLAEIEKDPHWQQSDALAVEHKALVAQRDKRRGDEPNIAVPHLDDPRDVQRFEQQVQADAKSRGVPPQYVFGDLKPLMEGLMKQGTAGQREALNMIGHFSTHAAFVAARQLAPQDGAFQIAATLQGDARELALAGRDALAGETGKAKAVTPDQMAGQLARIDQALGATDPDFAKAAKDTALAIAAELHRRQGKDRFDRGLADEAARLTLGGQMRGAQKLGGLGMVAGHSVVLPDDMTQDEFDKRYYRLAGPSQAYGSGRRLNYEELRRYRLVSSGDGDYQWHDAQGRVVTDDKGRVVTLHIRHVNPPPPPRFAPPTAAYQLEGM